MLKLGREAGKRRYVSPVMLSAFLNRHMKGKMSIDSDELTIHSIEDYCAFVKLSHLAKGAVPHAGWEVFFNEFELENSTGCTDTEHIRIDRINILKKHSEVEPHAD